ncbi:MAG: biotin/lipoyl-binding protein [Phycisphaerales bacterium]
MNLRITVEGKSYDVQVAVLEDGRPVNPRGPLSGLGAEHVGSTSAQIAEAEARLRAQDKAPKGGGGAKPAPEPWPSPATHHIYGPLPAKPGEVVCPVAGIISDVIAKAGEKVKPFASLAVLEVSHSISTGDKPVVGTVRASTKGTVREVLVKAGDKVKTGQVLFQIDEA